MIKTEGAVDICNTARAEFVLISFLCVFAPWDVPNYVWVVTSMLLMSTAWAIYQIYWCERYVLYVFAFISTFTLFMGYMCFISAGLYADQLEIEGAKRLVLVIGSPSVVFMTFAFAYFSPSKHFQYVIQGNGVEIGEWKGNARLEVRLCWIMIIAFIALAALAMIFLRGPLELVLCLVLTPLLTIAGLVIGRQKVRGVRVLLSLEKAYSLKFTFMDIEEIRRVRSRWLLIRFIKWLVSFRGLNTK